jgi:diaminopimelate epimerase
VKATHHTALGNDFLVVDVTATEMISTEEWRSITRRACDRTHGVGADGLLLLARRSEAVLVMSLFNADGTSAEMSGNGIRCLAQAASMVDGSSGEAEYLVHTDAGPRLVSVRPDGVDRVLASVDMGEVTSIEAPDGWESLECDPMRPVAHLSVGNPHAVVGVEDVSAVPLREMGERVPSINLEVVEAGPEINGVRMRVHERGVGITAACGTGACASAWAAASWGLVVPVGGKVVVHMDGGDVTVGLDQPEPGRVTLVGESVYLGSIDVER